jgi:exopolysaccharide biosynthesis polyprenyl glycosylphosphotransferase
MKARVEVLPAPPLAAQAPTFWRAHAHRGASDALIAASGRTALVAVVCWAMVARGRAPVAEATAAITIALAWSIALQVALAHSKPLYRDLGPAAATAIGSGLGFVVASAGAHWLPGPRIDVSDLLAAAVLLTLLVGAWEALSARLLAATIRLLIVGSTQSSRELLEILAHSDRHAFEVVGLVDDDAGDGTVAGVPVLGTIASLGQVIRETQPHLVIVGVERGRPDVFREIADASHCEFRVVGLPEFHEHAFGRVPIRHMSDSWFMSLRHLYQPTYSRVSKRAFDVVVAVIGVVVTAPLFPLIAALVRMTPGPILYRQTRLGEGGRPFTIYKFRTMRRDAEEGQAMWAAESDGRVTSFGRVLRRTRLDELPQLWNVLRGEMSVVGPRPERPEFLELLSASIPFWFRRHLLKPGITGWAQIHAGYAGDTGKTEEKLSYDLWYLRHRSLVLDFIVCVKTIPQLVRSVGR